MVSIKQRRDDMCACKCTNLQRFIPSLQALDIDVSVHVAYYFWTPFLKSRIRILLKQCVHISGMSGQIPMAKVGYEGTLNDT